MPGRMTNANRRYILISQYFGVMTITVEMPPDALLAAVPSKDRKLIMRWALGDLPRRRGNYLKSQNYVVVCVA